MAVFQVASWQGLLFWKCGMHIPIHQRVTVLIPGCGTWADVRGRLCRAGGQWAWAVQPLMTTHTHTSCPGLGLGPVCFDEGTEASQASFLSHSYSCLWPDSGQPAALPCSVDCFPPLLRLPPEWPDRSEASPPHRLLVHSFTQPATLGLQPQFTRATCGD